MDKQSILPQVLATPTPVTLGIERSKLTDIFCQDGTAAQKQELVAKYRDNLRYHLQILLR